MSAVILYTVIDLQDDSEDVWRIGRIESRDGKLFADTNRAKTLLASIHFPQGITADEAVERIFRRVSSPPYLWAEREAE